MGYLIGFLVAVYISGKFVYDNNLVKTFFKLFFATSFIYILGMIWLGSLIGWDKPIFKLGAQPFLLAEIFKILIATLQLIKLKKSKNYLNLSRGSFRKYSLQSSSVHLKSSCSFRYIPITKFKYTMNMFPFNSIG